MKQYLRNRVSKSASYFEILLSLFILAGILIISVSLISSLFRAIVDMTRGTYTFDFHEFVGQIMQLIIGVEFVKMLSKHTPESTIEVLLFVIARKIIVDEPGFVDMAVGILAIAILFLVRKFFTQKTNPEGCILEADTRIGEMNAILRTHCTDESCATVRDLIHHEMQVKHLPLMQGQEIVINDIVFKIYSLKDGDVDAVEAIPAKPHVLRWPWSRH